MKPEERPAWDGALNERPVGAADLPVLGPMLGDLLTPADRPTLGAARGAEKDRPPELGALRTAPPPEDRNPPPPAERPAEKLPPDRPPPEKPPDDRPPPEKPPDDRPPPENPPPLLPPPPPKLPRDWASRIGERAKREATVIAMVKAPTGRRAIFSPPVVRRPAIASPRAFMESLFFGIFQYG